MAPYVPGDNVNYGHMKVGYSVDEGQETSYLDPRLPLLQHADLADKVVLLRVDHNVVKKGDPRAYRSFSFATMSCTCIVLRIIYSKRQGVMSEGEMAREVYRVFDVVCECDFLCVMCREGCGPVPN